MHKSYFLREKNDKQESVKLKINMYDFTRFLKRRLRLKLKSDTFDTLLEQMGVEEDENLYKLLKNFQ